VDRNCELAHGLETVLCHRLDSMRSFASELYRTRLNLIFIT
jgi:hypothetical protein